MQLHPRLAKGLAFLCMWSAAHLAQATGTVTATSAAGTITVNTDINSQYQPNLPADFVKPSTGTTVLPNGCNGCAPTVNIWSTDANGSNGEIAMTMVKSVSSQSAGTMFEAFREIVTGSGIPYPFSLSQYAYADIPVALTLADPVNTSLAVTVSLQLLSNSGSTAQPFSLTVSGQDTSGATTLATLTGAGDPATNTWSFQGLLPAAGLSSLTVSFSVLPGEQATVGLNSIGLQLVSSVPEPASYLTLGLGLAALTLTRRRRQSRTPQPPRH